MSVLDEFEQSSYLSGESAGYIDSLFEAYLQDPNSVSDEWKNYFSSLPKSGSGSDGSVDISHADIREALKRI
ncbi:MAG TPA: hypothetical protein VJL60_05515, partial [Gammaproteobacteria bacterium]|nr:hypothetical protein [Gammaproteobacteria bacterium]